MIRAYLSSCQTHCIRGLCVALSYDVQPSNLACCSDSQTKPIMYQRYGRMTDFGSTSHLDRFCRSTPVILVVVAISLHGTAVSYNIVRKSREFSRKYHKSPIRHILFRCIISKSWKYEKITTKYQQSGPSMFAAP